MNEAFRPDIACAAYSARVDVVIPLGVGTPASAREHLIRGCHIGTCDALLVIRPRCAGGAYVGPAVGRNLCWHVFHLRTWTVGIGWRVVNQWAIGGSRLAVDGKI